MKGKALCHESHKQPFVVALTFDAAGELVDSKQSLTPPSKVR